MLAGRRRRPRRRLSVWTFPAQEMTQALMPGRRLSAALSDALRRKDTVAVSAFRSVLSAIGNAEAVSAPSAAPGAGSSPIAGAVEGLGVGETRRRSLSTADVDQIVRRRSTSAYWQLMIMTAEVTLTAHSGFVARRAFSC